MKEGEQEYERFEVYVKATLKALRGQAEQIQVQILKLDPRDHLKLAWNKSVVTIIGSLATSLQFLLAMLNGDELLLDGTTSEGKTMAAARRAWGEILHYREDAEHTLVTQCCGATIPYGFEAVELGSIMVTTRMTFKMSVPYTAHASTDACLAP